MTFFRKRKLFAFLELIFFLGRRTSTREVRQRFVVQLVCRGVCGVRRRTLSDGGFSVRGGGLRIESEVSELRRAREDEFAQANAWSENLPFSCLLCRLACVA